MSQSPLSPKEAATLRSYVSPLTTIGRSVCSFILAYILYNIAHLVNLNLTPQLTWRPVPPSLFLIWLYFKSADWTGGRKLRSLIKQDLECGYLLEEEHTIRRSIRIPDGNNSLYIIETLSGEVYMISKPESGFFKGPPKEQLIIRKCKYSDIIFSCRTKGAQLPCQDLEREFSETMIFDSSIYNRSILKMDQSIEEIITMVQPFELKQLLPETVDMLKRASWSPRYKGKTYKQMGFSEQQCFKLADSLMLQLYDLECISKATFTKTMPVENVYFGPIPQDLEPELLPLVDEKILPIGGVSHLNEGVYIGESGIIYLAGEGELEILADSIHDLLNGIANGSLYLDEATKLATSKEITERKTFEH